MSMDSTAVMNKLNRIRRACLNCRRKKTRCPGESPACSFCVRLDQPCQYAEPSSGRSRNRASSGAVPHDKEDTSYWNLIARVAQLEERLRMPPAGQTETVESPGGQGSQRGMGVFDTPNSWESSSSSARNISPAIGLAHSQSMLHLSPSLIENALDAYFLYSHNQPYSFFCESRLRQQAHQKTLPEHVLYAVVASAARFMEDQYAKSNFGSLCAQRSWELMFKGLYSDTEADLSFVQATALLSLFDFTACKSRSAWKKLGTAARIAQDLRSNFEPDLSFHVQDQEEQRRTFWSIYMLDGLTTCGRARPPAFNGHYCKVNLPCTELSFQLGTYEETQNLDQALSEVDTANNRTDFSAFARVILIATITSRASQYVMQDVNFRTEKPPWNGDSDYAAISSSLLHFEYQVGLHRPLKETLDMDGVFVDGIDAQWQSTEHTVFYYALYHLTHCILNHHFLLRCRLRPYTTRAPPMFTSRAFKTCREHARALTQLLEDAYLLGCQLRSSFLGYCSLMAGIINSLYQHDPDAEIRSQSQEAFQKNIEFLTRHAQNWSNAKLMLEELQKFNKESGDFQSLIVPEIIELNFDPGTIERLYNITDYNVISRRNADCEVTPIGPNDVNPRAVSGSLDAFPDPWNQSLNGHNSIPVPMNGGDFSHNQIPMPWVPGPNNHYSSHDQTLVSEVGMQLQYNHAVLGLSPNQMF